MGLPIHPDSPPAPCPAPSFLNDPARLPHASLPLNSSPLCSQRLALRWRTPARPAEPSWRVPSPCKSFWVHADQAGFTRVSSWSSQSSSGDIKLGCPWVSWSHWTRRSRSAAETGPGTQQGPRKGKTGIRPQCLQRTYQTLSGVRPFAQILKEARLVCVKPQSSFLTTPGRHGRPEVVDDVWLTWGMPSENSLVPDTWEMPP